MENVRDMLKEFLKLYTVNGFNFVKDVLNINLRAKLKQVRLRLIFQSENNYCSLDFMFIEKPMV